MVVVNFKLYDSSLLSLEFTIASPVLILINKWGLSSANIAI